MEGQDVLAREAKVAGLRLNRVSKDPDWRRSTLESAQQEPKTQTTGTRPKSVSFEITTDVRK